MAGGKKRQISDKWTSGFSTGGASKGTYAAVGAGGAVAGAGAAAAGASRGSLRSDEWEEDNLTGGGGSGFFVVGGNRQDRGDPNQSPRGSQGRRSSRGHVYGNIGQGSPSAQNGSGKRKGLGSALGIGAGAGMLAAALGRSKSKKGKSPNPQNQDPFSDDYEPDHDPDHEEPEMTERRGLMNNFDSDGPGAIGGEDDGYYGGGGEMREAGPSGWGGAATALGAGALGGAGLAYAAGGRRSSKEDPNERENYGMTSSNSGSSAGVGMGAGAFNATRPSTRESHSRTISSHRPSSSAGGGYTSGTNSNTGSGSGTAGQSHAGSGSGSGSGSATVSGGGISSSSTGGRTQGSPSMATSLLPPPRAPRDRQAHVIGNAAPSKDGAASLPGFQEGFGSGELGVGEPRMSSETFDTDSSGRTRDIPNLGNAALAAGAGAAGGLGALAAQHRESGGSTYSKGFYPSGAPSGYGSSSDQLPDEEGKKARHHSQFLSQNTNLLGPDAQVPSQSESETDEPTPLGGGKQHSRDRSGAQVYGNLGPPSSGYAQHGRLSTIRSVGEFGERSQSSEAFSGSGSNSGSASLRGMGGNGGSRSGALEDFASQYYQTGTSSPRGTLGEPRGARSFVSATGSGASRRGGSRMGVSNSFSKEAGGDGDELSQSDVDTADFRTSGEIQEIPDEESENRHDGEAAAASGGFFGGMAAGWHRLTMNPQSWLPGGTTANEDNDFVSQALTSTQDGDQDAEAIEQSQTARHDAPTASNPGVASDARSEHATIYRASTLDHGGTGGQSSPVALTSSSDVPNEGLLAAAGAAALAGSRGSPAPRSIGTSQSSSSQRGDGYAASVSNASGSGGSMSRRSASENASVMTGLDSLSQHPQASSSGASGSLSSGSRRSNGTGRGASESGASTGAASYSPSHLARGSSSSTRGSGRLRGSASGSGSGSGSFASSSRAAYAAGRQRDDAAGEGDYEGGWDSDAQSSNATAGGSLASHEPNKASSSNKKKRPRSNSAEAAGTRRLSSVADLPGQEEDDAELLRNLPLGGQGHFPSPSLGAAMLRQANRDAHSSASGHDRQGSGSGTEPNPTTPRAVPQSLLPGSSPPPPLPSTLHNSTSSRSLGDATAPPPAIHSPNGSGSWRQSPRVASASQRASAAAAHLEASRAEAFAQAQSNLSPSQRGGSLPRSGLPRSSSEEYAWGELGGSPANMSPPPSPRTRSRLRNLQREAEQGEAGLHEEGQEEGAQWMTQWPKFLRF